MSFFGGTIRINMVVALQSKADWDTSHLIIRSLRFVLRFCFSFCVIFCLIFVSLKSFESTACSMCFAIFATWCWTGCLVWRSSRLSVPYRSRSGGRCWATWVWSACCCWRCSLRCCNTACEIVGWRFQCKKNNRKNMILCIISKQRFDWFFFVWPKNDRVYWFTGAVQVASRLWSRSIGGRFGVDRRRRRRLCCDCASRRNGADRCGVWTTAFVRWTTASGRFRLLLARRLLCWFVLDAVDVDAKRRVRLQHRHVLRQLQSIVVVGGRSAVNDSTSRCCATVYWRRVCGVDSVCRGWWWRIGKVADVTKKISLQFEYYVWTICFSIVFWSLYRMLVLHRRRLLVRKSEALPSGICRWRFRSASSSLSSASHCCSSAWQNDARPPPLQRRQIMSSAAKHEHTNVVLRLLFVSFRFVKFNSDLFCLSAKEDCCAQRFETAFGSCVQTRFCCLACVFFFFWKIKSFYIFELDRKVRRPARHHVNRSKQARQAGVKHARQQWKLTPHEKIDVKQSLIDRVISTFGLTSELHKVGILFFFSSYSYFERSCLVSFGRTMCDDASKSNKQAATMPILPNSPRRCRAQRRRCRSMKCQRFRKK